MLSKLNYSMVNTIFNVWLSDSSGTYDDCCLRYVGKMSPRAQKHAVNYRVQVPDGGCNISAVM